MRAASGLAVNGGGRPRDGRIDDAVLRATVDLLEEVGYLRLTVGAIAERAATNKPAIYRRWPTKAHLVHEAVFPIAALRSDVGGSGDLRGDIRALVTIGADYLGRPAARAALPGLMAEMAGSPDLHADVIGRFSTGSWGWLQQRLDMAIATGKVRRGVQPATVLELIAGSALVATLIRPAGEALDGRWVKQVVEVIFAGIAA